MRTRPLIKAITAAFVALGLVTGTASAEKDKPGAGGFKIDNTKPIEITADSLELRQQESKAIFLGKVDVLQDKVRIRAQRLTVFYEGDAAADGKIRNLAAEGGVYITSGEDSAKGSWARYNVVSRIITMGGGVFS